MPALHPRARIALMLTENVEMTDFCEWCGAVLKAGGSLVHLGDVVCDDCFELSCTNHVVSVSVVDELDADLTEYQWP